MKILLIIPPFKYIYKDAKVKAGVPASPLLSLSTLGATLIKSNHTVSILDLNLHRDPMKQLHKELKKFEPEYAGLTFTTPLFGIMSDIASEIKQYNPKTIMIGGGAHASAMPEETLSSSQLDIVVIGEGDFVLPEVVSGKDLSQITGIAYKENGAVKVNARNDFIKDLDSLPFPAWELYDIKKYKTPSFMAKKNPAGWLETSRGCPYNCCYCNKSVFGMNFRPKSPGRVVEEIQYMLGLGFKEIHIADDMFTTDVERVKMICRLIIEKKIKFPWATVTGIRVDRGDQEMFDLMRKAGCYRAYFGVESGNQDVLNGIGKVIKLEQVVNAVKMARKAGMETCGYFMFALPGETEKTMQETIDFACSLNLDWAKASIMTPLPATRLYNELERSGKLKIKDWTKYNLYLTSNQIYEHSTLKWDNVDKYFNSFYSSFYLRPGYIFKRLKKSIQNRTLLSDIIYFLTTKW
jgi:radical SAM superfamily enzyme YgiQ (UPF0313 family)